MEINNYMEFNLLLNYFYKISSLRKNEEQIGSENSNLESSPSGILTPDHDFPAAFVHIRLEENQNLQHY